LHFYKSKYLLNSVSPPKFAQNNVMLVYLEMFYEVCDITFFILRRVLLRLRLGPPINFIKFEFNRILNDIVLGIGLGVRVDIEYFILLLWP